MDEGLKQRLVGATVLILLGVLVIPWLLDGAGVEDQQKAELELPVPKLSQAKVVPSPGASSNQPVPVTKPVVRPRPEAAKKTVSKAAKVAPSTAKTGWVAQVGSFRSEANAARLTAQLKKQGYTAFVMRHGDDGDAMFRVRVGPESARAQAESVAKRLKKDGHDSKVVSHP